MPDQIDNLRAQVIDIREQLAAANDGLEKNIQTIHNLTHSFTKHEQEGD
ncbi:MAG TPA: hypothetical protein VFY05_04685 [Candidatus Angelobacter sp.]|nr:hypothetical protein [Candidatus Angelobacter sp.]